MKEREEIERNKSDYETYQLFLKAEKMSANYEFDEERHCSFCRNIMVEPITLPKCGHSFCIFCLNMAFEKQKTHEKKCPLCRNKFN